MKKSLTYRLLSYVAPWPKLLALALIALLISKGIEAYIPLSIGQLSNEMLEKNIEFSSVITVSSMLLVLVIVAFILEGVNVVIRTWVGERALLSLRQDIYRHIQRLPLSYFDTHQVGMLMTRTIHDVDQINQMFTESLIPLVGSLFLFFAILAALLSLDLRLFILMLVILPSFLLLANYFRVHQRACYLKIRKIVAKMNGFIQEYLLGVWTIRSFNSTEHEKAEFEELNAQHKVANIDTIHYFASFFSGIDFLQSLSLLLVFLVLYFSPAGFLGGTFVSFSLYVIMLFRPLGDLAERYNVLQSALASAERIFSLMEVSEENRGGDVELHNIDEINFHDVWFRYEGKDFVFSGLNLVIKKGESIGIVGQTGAGKTTLLKLLLRFYAPERGTILINGRPIEQYTLSSLRRQFSLVLQDPEIFSGTIKENISLWKEGVDVDGAVRAVNLQPLLDRLPDGIQTRLLERGKSLSQGEKQLVSLARAIAYGGSVFVLDEATANIDVASEREIQKALDGILKTKTALIIAHRLSTIRKVKRVVVIADGRVVEEGSHEELLLKKGVYEKLYRLHFSA